MNTSWKIPEGSDENIIIVTISPYRFLTRSPSSLYQSCNKGLVHNPSASNFIFPRQELGHLDICMMLMSLKSYSVAKGEERV